MSASGQREELRDLEREWLVSGDVEDQAKWFAARVRLGDLPLLRLQQSAYLGHPGAAKAALGTWSPPKGETSRELSPAERVLTEGQLPQDLLCRAAGEAGARALEGSALDKQRATPRECVRVALGLQEVSAEGLAELVERSEQLVADEQGGLSLLLGIALLDRGSVAVEETALESARSARAAAAAAACARTVLGGDEAHESAAETLFEAASIAEDPNAERAWQAEFLSKLLLDQAPLVRTFAPPSQEARNYEELSEGNFHDCTCGQPEEDDDHEELGEPESVEDERRTSRNVGLALCGLTALYVLVSDATEDRRVPALACLAGFAVLQVVWIQAVNVLCLVSGVLFLVNAFVDWAGWPLWGRVIGGLAGLWWIRSSWSDLQRDAPSDAWRHDEAI